MDEKKNKMLHVITEVEDQEDLIDMIHQGQGETSTAEAMAGHMGRDRTYDILSERYFWKRMYRHVQSRVASCLKCQQHKVFPKQASSSTRTYSIFRICTNWC